MKTTIYNFKKAIIAAILVLIISSFGSAATKSDETSTSINRNNAKAAIVKHEATRTTGSAFEVPAANVKRDLSVQIEDWMSNGSYWETDNSSELSIKNLAAEIESWMSNGSYWKPINHGPKAAEKLSEKIKTWMTSGAYWGSDGK